MDNDNNDNNTTNTTIITTTVADDSKNESTTTTTTTDDNNNDDDDDRLNVDRTLSLESSTLSDNESYGEMAVETCAMLSSMTQAERDANSHHATTHASLQPIKCNKDGLPSKEQVPHQTMQRMLAYFQWAEKKEFITEDQRVLLENYLPFRSWSTVLDRKASLRSRSSSRQSGVSTQSSMLDDVAAAMTDPRTGVKIGRRKRRWGFKHYMHVFAGNEAVDWMIHRQIATTRQMAVEIGRELLRRGYFAHVTGQHTFEDDTIFFRFTEHVPSFSLALSPNVPALKSSLLRLVYHVHENTVMEWLNGASPREIYMSYPAVLLWLKAHPDYKMDACDTMCSVSESNPMVKMAMMGFMAANGEDVSSFKVKLDDESKRTMDLGNRQHPAAVAKEYQKNRVSVLHPFTGDIAESVTLKKEFTSNAKPAWVRFNDIDGTPMMPDIVAKYGDDLRKDLAVQLIFKAMDAIWSAAPVRWRLGHPPSVCTYQVLVTSEKGGLIEFVKGKTVKDVEHDKEWDTIDLTAFAPTAVGSYVAGFVLGVRDRHSENWMCVDMEDDPKLMQIDFGYMLLENPGGFPLDTPRLTMQPVLIKLMKKCQGVDGENSLMYDFKRDLVTAYGVLRRHMHALASFCEVVLSNVYEPAKVQEFMFGPHAFRAGEDENRALEHFENKVRKSLTTSNFRRGAKHALVKGYYAVRKII